MPEKKRINFFGSSLVSAYWNGAATYYRGIIKALNALGFEITFFEPDVYDRQNHRDLDELAYAKSVVYPAKCTEDIIRVLSTAANTDIVIKASGVGVFDRLLEEEILKMKTKDNIVIFWDVDAPATLERMQENSDDYFRKIVREYDLILTYGGGEPVVEKYKSFGAKKCIPIYNALDPDTHYPVDRNTNFSADLAFLGNRMPDRESRVFEFFFKPAQMLPTKKFLLGGSGWDQNIPALPNLSYVGHVYTSLHNAFNCSPLAVLNISRDSMAKYGFSPATRLFEAAGAASCIITDKWQGIEEFLEPQQECLVAENGKDVADIISDLTPEKARDIGSRAMKRILTEHTYNKRALMFKKIIEDEG